MRVVKSERGVAAGVLPAAPSVAEALVRGARGAGLEVAAAADSRRNAGVHAPVSLASASGKALGLGALMVLRVRRLEAGGVDGAEGRAAEGFAAAPF